jgi:hypothetical protein
MSRWMGWMLAVGVSGALMAGCNGPEASKQSGRFNEPVHQKYQSPAASEAESGRGGSGGAGSGVALDKGWQDHPANEDSNQGYKRGPFVIDQPQAVPPERRPGPLGVGSGTDSSRKMAQDQLKE